MKSTKSDDPATIGNLYGTAAATAAVFIPRLISYRFLSRDSCDSVPPPMSSWYVSPIWVPLSTSRDRRYSIQRLGHLDLDSCGAHLNDFSRVVRFCVDCF